jgi:hypothetical protein
MRHHHPSRLVTLGENLAALMQTGTQAAIGLGSIAGAVIGAPFREPRRDCGCGAARPRCNCCYDPPVYGCGRW